MGILPDKAVKKDFKKKTSLNPDKYYATGVLRREGYKRYNCSNCSTYFWSQDSSDLCGDPSCSGGFRFFKDNPAKEKLDYVGVWKKFKELFSSRGYTPIKRYPVIARWRDDTEFVQASIYNFQPYVVSGEVDPPANPLVVPQFCVRFNDIDNVGVTMSHHTGFVMIGQHTFVSEDKWDQEKLFNDLFVWFTQGLGIPKEELVFHEDAWAGGGNFGPCMEFFSRGCELANQVYMLYEQTEEGPEELPLKVLDMGMGHERIAWFTQGKGTIYDAVFPTVMQKLFEKTGVEYDEELVQKYLPYGSYLNMDEVDDIDSAWELVATSVGVDREKLQTLLQPLAALYSVAEHARSLLFVLSDGGLPSNVGGGYNLRVILRRALRFIDQYGWDINLPQICRWHAEYLKPLFPELSENLENVEEILNHEKEKYVEAKKRHKKLIDKLVKEGKEIDVKNLLELYDSHGIAPEDLKEAARKSNISINVPENFYSLVAQKHEERKPAKTATKKENKLDLRELPGTNALYFDHFDYVSFEANVLRIIEERFVVLDRSAFYPTGGGQLHDLGSIAGIDVVEVFKQATPRGVVIIHVLAENASFEVGSRVEGKIDYDRRLQLAQHHSATHILTGSARAVLGNHVWQAGAAKTVEKSRLDITHYCQLTEEQIVAVEELANKIVSENRPIVKSFMDRSVAEGQFGFRLYQGGAVPGKKLRIVQIENFDTEACGGTHLDVTGDVGRIKILKTSKIQDGVLRLEFVAGAAAQRVFDQEKKIISEALIILGGEKSQLPGRAQELFNMWKKAKKGKLEEFSFQSSDSYDGDIIAQISRLLKTQPEHIVKTLKRFKSDIEKKLSGHSSGKPSQK